MHDGLVLRLRRILPAPQAAVYSALTEPAELAKWWGPHGFTAPRVEFHPRVGAGYRIAMQPPDSELFHLAGEFRSVDPPVRLAYTFRWDPPDPDDRQTLVTLTLTERGERTELRLTQAGFVTEARRALHEAGWTDSLARLEQLLDEPPDDPRGTSASDDGGGAAPDTAHHSTRQRAATHHRDSSRTERSPMHPANRARHASRA
jgi:uncharacterized protein YndB with AHSA1/START domain